MSFLPAQPKQLYFSALQAPDASAPGGETALADFRKVYKDLPEWLRDKLAAKRLHYRRTHHKIGATNTHNVAAMKSWPQLFGTSDEKEVEQLVAAGQASNHTSSMRWVGRNKDIFVQEWISEPFQEHPQTGQMVWFNDVQVFHWSSFAAEYLAAYRRTGVMKVLGHALCVGVKSSVKYGILGHQMALHVEFGDGTHISIRKAQQIRRALHKNRVLDHWQQGDLLMIDNFSTSHGRQPTYDSGRKVVVSWSEAVERGGA